MAKVIIKEHPRLEGAYDFDAGYFSNRELHLIKKETGVRAGEMEEAFQAGDNDLLVVLAYIALQRNGRADVPLDALWDMEIGSIDLDFSDEEVDDADPKSEPVSNTNGDGSTSSSSESS